MLSKLAVEHAPHGKLINNHGKIDLQDAAVLRRGKETNCKEAAKKAWKLFISQSPATRERPFSAGLRAEEEGVMSGKFEIYLEGGGGWGRGGTQSRQDRDGCDLRAEHLCRKSANCARNSTRTYFRCNEPSDGRRWASTSGVRSYRVHRSFGIRRLPEN